MNTRAVLLDLDEDQNDQSVLLGHFHEGAAMAPLSSGCLPGRGARKQSASQWGAALGSVERSSRRHLQPRPKTVLPRSFAIPLLQFPAPSQDWERGDSANQLAGKGWAGKICKPKADEIPCGMTGHITKVVRAELCKIRMTPIQSTCRPEWRWGIGFRLRYQS